MTELGNPGVALVTGAGAGIGRACAVALARTGAPVVVTDINEAATNETCGLIAADGGASTPYKLDVTDQADWDHIVAELELRHGSISTLVNNAGYKASLAPNDRGLVELDDATWDRMLAVNLFGPMLGSRRVLPGMLKAGRGSIIMFSSVTALACPPNIGVAYNAAKSGLLGLMRSIAVSYGSKGVRCNSVLPGVTVVDESSLAQREFDASTVGLTGRAGRAKDMADAVVFLASDSSSFINGQAIVVDGGLTSHLPGLTTANVGKRG
jgi:NAD(P)-dependent dehydrogenase (short-subunit alcohol dehydrogenase family)